MQTENQNQKNAWIWSVIFIGGPAIIVLLVFINFFSKVSISVELQKEFSQIPIPPNSQLLYKKFYGCPINGTSSVQVLYLSDLSPEEIATYFSNLLEPTKWDYSSVVASPMENPVHWSIDGYWRTNTQWEKHLGIDVWRTDTQSAYEYLLPPDSLLRRYTIDAKLTMFYVNILQIDDIDAYLALRHDAFDNWGGKCKGSWDF